VRPSAGKAKYLPSAGLARYFAGRLLVAISTLLVVSVLVFGAIHLVPGSYSQVVLGPYSTAQERAKVTRQFGLNRPIPLQYFYWVRGLFHGDLGFSTGTQSPVSTLLQRRIPVTLELGALALLFATVVGVPLALAAGLASSRAGRGASRLGGAAAISTPDFVIGSVLVYLFSRYHLGLRVGEYVPLVDDPVSNLEAMLLPALTLSVFGIAVIVRTGRDAVGQVLSEPYVAAARARGETTLHLVRHHVLRNASIPVLTVMAIYTGYLMGGAVIVENLFSLPGLGQAAVIAINGRDYAVIESVVLVAAAAFITINMLADVAYGLIDPRVRVGVAHSSA
jgi:peptide/nickel transport system permease protein